MKRAKLLSAVIKNKLEEFLRDDSNAQEYRDIHYTSGDSIKQFIVNRSQSEKVNRIRSTSGESFTEGAISGKQIIGSNSGRLRAGSSESFTHSPNITLSKHTSATAENENTSKSKFLTNTHQPYTTLNSSEYTTANTTASVHREKSGIQPTNREISGILKEIISDDEEEESEKNDNESQKSPQQFSTPQKQVSQRSALTNIGGSYKLNAAVLEKAQQRSEKMLQTSSSSKQHNTEILSTNSTTSNTPQYTPHTVVFNTQNSTVTTATAVPTLQSIFLGPNRLLQNVATADCEHIHSLLLAAGCRGTEHFIQLIRWQMVNSHITTGMNGLGTDVPVVDVTKCMQICTMQLGIPVFHAMELIELVKPHLNR